MDVSASSEVTLGCLTAGVAGILDQVAERLG